MRKRSTTAARLQRAFSAKGLRTPQPSQEVCQAPHANDASHNNNNNNSLLQDNNTSYTRCGGFFQIILLKDNSQMTLILYSKN